jgi:hypothetical protein
MLRKCVGLLVVLCAGSLVLAQDKDKGKDKGKKPAGTPAEIVKVDVKGMMLTLKVDGKEGDYKATKETKFIGPKGGKATIKDKRLQKGVMVRIVTDGKTLKEVHIPTVSRKDKDKSKKDKDKDKKDK